MSHNRRSIDYVNSEGGPTVTQVCAETSEIPTCAHCGELITTVGAKKYCSHECYTAARLAVPVEPRFWSRVDKSAPHGCWIWTGAVNADWGYGQFAWKARYGHNRPIGAHRIAYELTHGPIPEGLSVLHHCDNPPCCNPAHLFLGDHRANMADAVAKGRYHTARPGKQKFTDEQVSDMLRRRAAGETCEAIARSYGVTKAYISLLSRGLRRQYSPVSSAAQADVA